MTTAVQHRRGTTAEHSTFTGLEGEVTIDTTKDTAVIHDGVLAGGYPLAKENLANVTTSGLSSIDGASTASDDKFFIYDQSATTLKTITRAELNNAIEQDALANVAITGGTINGTAIGGTTAAAGAFTTLTTSSTVTHNGGTANGVAYLNGSKVLTTGSALTFDGSSMVLNTSTSSDALRITQTGSGNALAVEDSANPDSTPFVIDANGREILGYTSTLTVNNYAGNPVVPARQQIAISGAATSTLQAMFAATNYAVGTIAAKSRGTTVGDYAVVNNGDRLYSLNIQGADGTAFIPAADISAYVDGTPGTNDMPGRLVFSTSADGSATPTERLRIDSSGTVTNYGNTVLGDASTDTVTVNGYMGVGGAASGGISVYARNTALTGTSQVGFQSQITATSASTTGVYGLYVVNSTEAASFTVGNAYGVRVANLSLGAGSAATNQHGLHIADLTSATNNYGITSLVSSGSNKWNIYASGTAQNYFAGNVGIGTSSPGTRLDVNGSTYNPLVIRRDGGTDANTGVVFQLATNYWNVGAGTDGNFGIAYNSTNLGTSTQFRITSSGNVGIGTSSPARLLTVNSGASTGYIQITNSTSGTATSDGFQLIHYTSGAVQLWNYENSYMAFGVNNTEAMRIDSSGNVGIGTSSPTARLTVQDATAGNGTIRYGDGATDYGQIFYRNLTGEFRLGTYGTTTIGMTFLTGGTERARIDSSGNLLVGTTISKAKLTVEGQAAIGSANSTPNGIYLYINDVLSDNSYLSRNSNGVGTTTWYIGNQAITTSSDARLKDNVKPSERNAIALLNQWEIVDHTWNDPSDQCESNRNSRGVWTGVVAQQVQPITPWLVNKPTKDVNEDGTINPWTMDFGYAVPLLVKAIQEQQAIINTLTARVTALESK